MDIKNNIFSKVTLFENKVAEWFNAPYGVAVDCCTHGLELCLSIIKLLRLVLQLERIYQFLYLVKN